MSADAVTLLAGLRARGLTLWIEETPEGLSPKVLGRPTPEDRAALAGQREEIIALLLAESREQASRTERTDPPSPWRK